MERHDTSHFVYEPLQDAWDIRLLSILPPEAAQDGTVHCELSVWSLEDDIKYSALSYVWGAPHITHPVIVNGCEVQVTTNLAAALSQLQANGVTALWVDALCIDQANEVEKNHQVQIMDTIYREAQTVMAWLGAADEGSKRAVAAIEELARVASSAGLRNVLSPRVGDVPKDQKGGVLDSICSSLLSTSSNLADGDIGCAIALLERPYWRRLWILQEISLARSAVLVCGASSVSWEEAESALAVIKWLRHLAFQESHRFRLFSQRLHALYAPFVLEDWRPPPAADLSAHATKGTRLSLFDVLDLTNCGTALECSDPRDRVYGVLGLVDENYPFSRTVEYAAPYVDVFVYATLSMLLCHGPIALVFAGLAAHETQRDGETKLPTWAVDWRCTQRRAQEMWQFVPDAQQQEFALSMSEDRLEIAVAAASAAEVFAVVPCSRDFRGLVRQFASLREELCHRRLEEGGGNVLAEDSMETMLWHALLYTAKVTPCSDQEISELFHACVHPSPEAGCASSQAAHDSSETAHNPPQTTHNPPQTTHNPPSPQLLPNNQDNPPRTFPSLLWIKTPRILFLTTSGEIGSGPLCTRVGDVVHAIPGLEMPLLLREDEAGGKWEVVGGVFVGGMVEVSEGGFFTMEGFWRSGGRGLRDLVLC